jgi:PAS domain S-box-containing protein
MTQASHHVPASVLDHEHYRRDSLEQAGARFLALSDDPLAIWSHDGTVKWVNVAYERATGFRAEEVIGRPYLDFVHADDRERTITETARRPAGRSASFGFEARFCCRDGSHCWFLISATPDPEEELIYVIAKDVTQRRRLEEESTRFLELSLDLLCIVDLEGLWRRVNPAFSKELGWRWEELAGRPYLELVHPEDRDQVAAEAQKLTEPGAETRDFRARLLAKDNSYRSFLWSAASNPAEGLIYAVGRDESERERVGEVLREAEERFQGAFDKAPIGMALVSMEREGAGVFLRVNDALCRLIGYEADELVGTGFHDIAHPDDYDPDLHYVPWMRAGEISQYEVEKRLVHANGHVIWAQITNSIVRDGNDRPLYLITQVQDITERKRAERQLLESRERLQAIVDNTTAIISVKDRDGRFQLVNQRFEMVHGVQRDEAVGKTADELFPEEIAERHRADDAKVIQSLLTLELEEVLDTREGQRTYLTTKFPLFESGRAERIPYAICTVATDISERKRAEEALRASEQHFRQIVNTAHDAFVAMDASGIITAWSPQAEKTFGWPENEALGRSLAHTIIPARHREAHYRGLESFLDTGRGPIFDRRIELEALHRDGHEFPVEMTVTPLRVANGYVFNAFLHDISERRQAEEQIRRLASIVESSGDVIIGTTPEGAISSWNRAAEREYGYRADEAIGRALSIIHPGDGPDAGRSLLGEVLRGREINQLETTARHKDGHIVDVSVSVSPIRSASGDLVGASYIARDITERKRAERALREVQEGFRSAFEGSPIGVALQSVAPDSVGRLLQVNRSLCEITGYATMELLSMTLAELTHPEDMEEEQPLHDKLVEGEIPNYRIEKRYLRKDGTPVWVMHNASTVHDASGKLLYGIAQVEDISERKRAEESLSEVHAELERRAAELERSNADLQQFAYAASHDLSEPLRMVSSYVQLLARRYSAKLDEDANEFIGFAVDGAARMQALIDGLLLYSRAGTSEYELEPVDVSEVLDATLLMLKTAIEESGAEVTADPLPTVLGDANQLSQLLQNLVANAIKFVEDGPPRIHVSAEKEGDEWHFAVSDNGIGIDPAHAERIFNVFQRLHGRGEYPGSGIGLAICKRIVERHGGRIWVEPGIEGGSSFNFTIPVAREAADDYSVDAGRGDGAGELKQSSSQVAEFPISNQAQEPTKN